MADATTEGAEPPAEKPEYDQKFFLALALKGKDEWNKWRREHKDIPVTFAGVDFSEAPRDQIDFSGFEFGGYANFSKCKWRGCDLFRCSDVFKPGRACFSGASFGDGANFEDVFFGDFPSFNAATFADVATFKGAIFGAYASFAGPASFGERVSFEGAVFGYAASFSAAVFHGETSFADATFDDVSFEGAIFSGITSFDGAAFGDYSRFEFAVFKGPVTFQGKSIEQWGRSFEFTQSLVRGLGPEALEALEKRHRTSRGSKGSAPDRFGEIWLPSARFYNDANFSGRFFERAADFTNVQFYRPPDFNAVTNASKINFTGVHLRFGSLGNLPWDSKVLGHLRAFRKVAEETKNHDLERRSSNGSPMIPLLQARRSRIRAMPLRNAPPPAPFGGTSVIKF